MASQTSFFVYMYIYTDVSSDFYRYIPAFVTHNQYGSGRLIKLEREESINVRSVVQIQPLLFLRCTHTQTHTEKTLYFLFFFFSLFLMQLSEQNEQKNTQPLPQKNPQKNRKTYGWMDGCCWERSRGPPTHKKKRRDGSVQSSLVDGGGAHLAQHQQEKHSQNEKVKPIVEQKYRIKEKEINTENKVSLT